MFVGKCLPSCIGTGGGKAAKDCTKASFCGLVRNGHWSAGKFTTERASVPENREEDRRRWSRVTIAIPMFISGDNGGHNFLEFGTAVNLSAGGALIATRRFIAPKTQVRLEIPTSPLPHAAIPQAARVMFGRLLRVEAAADHNLLAIAFDEPLQWVAALRPE